MNKFERIELVKNYQLNTEENILITKTTKPIMYADFLTELKNCSIRTFRGNDKITPHYPIVTKHEAFKIIPDLLNKNYNIILATPINPKDCEFAAAAWQKENQLIIELAYGPGTVRRVTHDNKIDKRYILNNNELTNDNRINKSIKQFKNTGLENVIFEFSYYKKPVGYKKEKFICWEITDDGTRRSKI